MKDAVAAFVWTLAVALAQTPQTRIVPSQMKNVPHTAQLLDWQFIRVSSKQISFGANCLPATPCNVSIGGIVQQFTNGPYLINLTNSHTGTIWVYISNIGTLTIGVPSVLTGDVSSPSVTITGHVDTTPADCLILARWDVSGGNFATTGYAFASYLSYSPIPIAGAGILVTGGPRPTIQVDTGSVLRKFTCAGGPTTSLPAGATQGDVCWDFTPRSPALYVCGNADGCTAAVDWRNLNPGCENDGSGNVTCPSFTATLGGPSILSLQSPPGDRPAPGTLHEWGDLGTGLLMIGDSGGRVSQTFRPTVCPAGQHLASAKPDGTFTCN